MLVGIYIEIPVPDFWKCWAGRGKNEQRVKKREDELDERREREIYAREQIKSLKLYTTNFPFSVVYNLPDLGGQDIKLSYYIQPLVITGNHATLLAKHTWSQRDCLHLTEDFLLI